MALSYSPLLLFPDKHHTWESPHGYQDRDTGRPTGDMGRRWGCVAVSVRSAPREELCTCRGAGAAPGAAGQSLEERMERTRAAVCELSPGPGNKERPETYLEQSEDPTGTRSNLRGAANSSFVRSQ